MTKEIAEIAKALEEAKISALGTIGSLNKGFGHWYAEALYNAGYRKEKTCKNITKNPPVDEFICSECGLILQGYHDIGIDRETGDEYSFAFEIKYCPCCGAKVVEE